jgi:pimeloyl-ACP methyl ester carboxylesterase
MDQITAHETDQVDAANASGRTPVVFVHGLWLLPSSWDRWREHFEAAGYATLAPGWPDDPETVEEANANPGVFSASRSKVADHFATSSAAAAEAVVSALFGRLMTQISRVGGCPRRRWPSIRPRSGRSAAADLGSRSRLGLSTHEPRACRCPTYERFRYSFASGGEARSDLRCRTGPLSAPPRADPGMRTKSLRARAWPALSGCSRSVAWSIANASFQKQKRNAAVTEIVKVPGRGHALTIDSGWQAVADLARDFIKRFAPPT